MFWTGNADKPFPDDDFVQADLSACIAQQTRRRHSEYSPVDGEPVGGLYRRIVNPAIELRIPPGDLPVADDLLNFGPWAAIVTPFAPPGGAAAYFGLGGLRELPCFPPAPPLKPLPCPTP